MSELEAQVAAGLRRSNAPVRGTQSFVGVMSAVWKRPSLTALEIAWRWTFAVLAAAGVWIFAHDEVTIWVLKVQNIAAILARGRLVGRGTADVRNYEWALVALVVAWAVFAGIGRGGVLRRWDRTLRTRRGTLVVLTFLGACAFAAVIAVWFELLLQIAQRTVWQPMAVNAEPAYVPGFAMAVTVTLLLFIFWAAVSWVLRIAPVLAMSRGWGVVESLRGAVRLGKLRSKLVEINLVMGIVKVALVVLAMVFSACPLPFESVESRAFLTWWCCGVAVLYVLASDYFHVVRAAAYERLYRIQDVTAGDESR